MFLHRPGRIKVPHTVDDLDRAENHPERKLFERAQRDARFGLCAGVDGDPTSELGLPSSVLNVFGTVDDPRRPRLANRKRLRGTQRAGCSCCDALGHIVKPMALDEDLMDTPMNTPQDTTSEPVMTQRPVLTIAQAAEATSTSESTIRRKIKAGVFEHAFQEHPGEDVPNNTWFIPIEDLIAAGYKVNAPTPPDEGSGEQVIDLRDGIDEKDLRIVRLEGERDVWRAKAEERERTIDMTDRAMRILPSATVVEPKSSTPLRAAESDDITIAVTDPTPSPTRQPWWRRKKPSPMETSSSS